MHWTILIWHKNLHPIENWIYKNYIKRKMNSQNAHNRIKINNNFDMRSKYLYKYFSEIGLYFPLDGNQIERIIFSCLNSGEFNLHVDLRYESIHVIRPIYDGWVFFFCWVSVFKQIKSCNANANANHFLI